MSFFKIFAAKNTLNNVNDYLCVFYTSLFRLGQILCKISARTAVGHLRLSQRSAQRRLYFFLWAQMTSELHVYREHIWRFQSAQRLGKSLWLRRGVNHLQICFFLWTKCSIFKESKMVESQCFISIYYVQECEIRHVDRLYIDSHNLNRKYCFFRQTLWNFPTKGRLAVWPINLTPPKSTWACEKKNTLFKGMPRRAVVTCKTKIVECKLVAI